MDSQLAPITDDWEYLKSFLPEGWQGKAKELGALSRCRAFDDADSLLRALLIHLAEGCSLRETAMRAKLAGLCSVSDVALLKRLKASGNWLRWMAEGVMKQWVPKQPVAIFGNQFRIRLIDASNINEPGPTGSKWRLHYSVQLPSLGCNEVYITTQRTGESLKRFKIKPEDLLIADRGYATRPGIRYVVNKKGNVIVRCNLNLPLQSLDSNKFELLPRLRELNKMELGDWDIFLAGSDWKERVAGRICAIKKSKEAAEIAKKKLLRRGSKQGKKIKQVTLEAAEYTFVFTTLGHEFKPSQILEMYRGRWQVELVFKRLKSIIELGHLKKVDSESAAAWLHGKLLVAFLVEALIFAAESFSPWGYVIEPDPG